MDEIVHPLSSRASIYGRLGLADWTGDYDIVMSYTNDEVQFTDELAEEGNGSGISVGLGLSFSLTDAWLANLEATQYEVEDGEVRFLGVGVTYRFAR